MQKKRICALVGAIILTLSGCNKKEVNNGQYFADVTEAPVITESSLFEDDEDTENVPENLKIVFTDYINAPTVSGIAVKAEDNYYIKQLSEAEQYAFSEIVAGMIDYKEYITLSKSITEDQLVHIMNIAFTNAPETYVSEMAYEYDVNESGYIRNFYPIYAMDFNTYQGIKSELDAERLSRCKNKSVNEYNFLYDIYKATLGQAYLFPLVAADTDYIKGYVNATIAGTKKLGKTEIGLSSLGCAKYIKFFLDNMGIENIVCIGQILSSGSDDPINSIYPQIKFNTKFDPLKNVYRTTSDVCNYHAWNLVNIGGTWVNCDAWYDYYLKTYEQAPAYTMFCVPDEITRQTRLFYTNDNILGITPPCDNYNYQFMARHGYFIPNCSDESIKYYVEALVEDVAFNKSKGATIQFESESNYIAFMAKIDDEFAAYNSNHNKLIASYTILPCSQALLVQINEIVYST